MQTRKVCGARRCEARDLCGRQAEERGDYYGSDATGGTKGI